jgi:glycosyltransferase involved in cell wall biosynthesis
MSGSPLERSPDVSLVIPGRNAAGTLRECLDAVVPLLRTGELREIIFVDDGSTDNTAEIAAEYPVRYVRVDARGPGAARNEGWRAATGDAVWFIDSDCVPAPNALASLRHHLMEPNVAGVGGSYSNARPDSLLASIIQEEIRERHLSMGGKVDYLGSFNVLYWRWGLEKVGGFDERDFNAPRAPGAEDADLSYRLIDAGHVLLFEPNSIVAHFHPTRLASYFKSQRLHGRWAARLYYRHRGRAGKNSYASWVDHIQPPIAVGAALTVPLVTVPGFWPVPAAFSMLLAGLQAPMTVRLIRRTGSWRYAAFAPMSIARAVFRGVGLGQGLISLVNRRPSRNGPVVASVARFE